MGCASTRLARRVENELKEIDALADEIAKQLEERGRVGMGKDQQMAGLELGAEDVRHERPIREQTSGVLVTWVRTTHNPTTLLRQLWCGCATVWGELAPSVDFVSHKSSMARELLSRYGVAHGMSLGELLHLLPGAMTQAEGAIELLLEFAPGGLDQNDLGNLNDS